MTSGSVVDMQPEPRRQEGTEVGRIWVVWNGWGWGMKKASPSVCRNSSAPEVIVRWLGVSRGLLSSRDLRVLSLVEGKGSLKERKAFS